jgi:hypothetical protein
MSCSVPANQPIYQALIDKAASYTASATQKPYQAKAYKKAAESVATTDQNIYRKFPIGMPGIGDKIDDFIIEFIKANPEPTGLTRSITCGGNLQYCGHPECSDNTKSTQSTKTIQENPMIAANYLNDAWHVEYMKKWRAEQAAARAEYLKTPVYTPENPRRSKRNINKPKVQYFDQEDELDQITTAIEAVCVKKGYEFSDELVTEFEAYLPTADKNATEKYDYNTGKYITRTKPEIAKQWAMYYSTSLQEQLLLKKLSKAIVKYCEKNNIAYQEVMAEKFAAWKADPANKKLITYTYSSFSGCACGSCDPTGTKMANTTSYTYERTPTYCVKQWFSTLKKTIVW